MRKSQLTLMLLLNGCAIAVADNVVCDRTALPSDAHVAGLLVDGGPVSLVTGQNLISTLDAYCERS